MLCTGHVLWTESLCPPPICIWSLISPKDGIFEVAPLRDNGHAGRALLSGKRAFIRRDGIELDSLSSPRCEQTERTAACTSSRGPSAEPFQGLTCSQTCSLQNGETDSFCLSPSLCSIHYNSLNSDSMRIINSSWNIIALY